MAATKTTLENGAEATIRLPVWCFNGFPAQIKALQNELDDNRERIQHAESRIDYIEKVFGFCTETIDGLDFSDQRVVTGLIEVLDLLGWKAEPLDSSDPLLLRLTDTKNETSIAYVSVGNGAPNRVQLGSLIMVQTRLWQSTGTEVKAFLIYDAKTAGELTEDFVKFASMRSISVLPKSVLGMKAAEVLLAESDPDEVRESLLVGLVDKG